MNAEAEVEQQEKDAEKAMESAIYDSNSFPWKWFWLATAVGVGWRSGDCFLLLRYPRLEIANTRI